jgi:hypothetical protein
MLRTDVSRAVFHPDYVQTSCHPSACLITLCNVYSEVHPRVPTIPWISVDGSMLCNVYSKVHPRVPTITWISVDGSMLCNVYSKVHPCVPTITWISVDGSTLCNVYSEVHPRVATFPLDISRWQMLLSAQIIKQMQAINCGPADGSETSCYGNGSAVLGACQFCSRRKEKHIEILVFLADPLILYLKMNLV